MDIGMCSCSCPSFARLSCRYDFLWIWASNCANFSIPDYMLQTTWGCFTLVTKGHDKKMIEDFSWS